jgi:hypothetical protein
MRERGERNTKKDGRETEPGENFGPSTSSTSCFYHHCLRLERRRLDRELEKERAEPRRGRRKQEGGRKTKKQRGKRNEKKREQPEGAYVQPAERHAFITISFVLSRMGTERNQGSRLSFLSSQENRGGHERRTKKRGRRRRTPRENSEHKR